MIIAYECMTQKPGIRTIDLVLTHYMYVNNIGNI